MSSSASERDDSDEDSQMDDDKSDEPQVIIELTVPVQLKKQAINDYTIATTGSKACSSIVHHSQLNRFFIRFSLFHAIHLSTQYVKHFVPLLLQRLKEALQDKLHPNYRAILPHTKQP